MPRRDLSSRRSKTAKVAMDGLTRLMREETRREELKQQARDARSRESSDGASSTDTDSVSISYLEESHPDLIKAIEDLRRLARGYRKGMPSPFRTTDIHRVEVMQAALKTGDIRKWDRSYLAIMLVATGWNEVAESNEIRRYKLRREQAEAELPIRRVLGGIKTRPPEERSQDHESAGATHEQEQVKTTAFESAVAQGATRDRDGSGQVRDDEPVKRRSARAVIRPFRAIYWKNLAYLDSGKKKVSAQQARIQRERHPINEGRAWLDILRILSNDTTSGRKAHARVMETIMLPPGVSARWTRDPGESLLEIMQHTGSHVQSLPSEQNAEMPGLTLYGTPAQNDAATRYLRSSDLLSASSKLYDDVSPLLSAHELHKVTHESSGENHGDARHEADAPIPDEELDLLNSVLDATYMVQSATAEPGPVRAVWHRTQPDLYIPLSTLLRTEQDAYTASPTSRLPSLPEDSISFTERILTLTAYRPRLLKYKGKNETRSPYHEDVQEELVRLLKSGFDQKIVTLEAVVTALDWLGRHMYFPAVRAIVLAADTAEFHLSAEVFDTMLRFAAISPSVDTFRYLVRFMHRAGGKATAVTWLHFESLTWRFHPSRVEEVREAMHEAGVHFDKDAKLELFKQDAPHLLTHFVKRHPDAKFDDFVRDIVSQYPDIARMGRRAANSLVDAALLLGRSDIALDVVRELIRQGERPNTTTLDHFLHSARRNRHVESAVAILSIFTRLPYKLNEKTETPLVSIHDDYHNAQYGNVLFEPSTRAFSVILSASSFRWLLWLAWDRRMWNCFRVFWRYACMAGHVDYGFVVKMKASLRAGQTARWDPKRHSNMPLLKRAGPGVPNHITGRTRVWDVWAARFVLGNADGLETWDAADKPVRRGPRERPKPDRMTDWFERLDLDLREVQSLKPVRPLAELAEEAYQLDLEWRKLNFGTTKGCTEGKWKGTEMLQVMMKAGIQVPVEVGSGVGMMV
ncbi:hypothetical protein B0A48_11683 [Cryoendolithus antarcticus]|uniref:Uncharacterized protein n=1 Tax=Cryoendolithus antarcticus TaxID=1507870 RepID=A0A1V8SSY9_9PEZI|nr:hypothetical protein B0A48_11683 [Cryoendolithus antarcticus]